MKFRVAIFILASLVAGQNHAIAESSADASKPASWTATPAKASPALRAAWDGYMKSLEDARVMMESTSIFEDTQYRARAYHVLMEMQAMAYNTIIAPRMTHPQVAVVTVFQRDFYTLGLSGPDCLYAHVLLDGKQVYRMKGRRGDLSFFSILAQNHVFGGDNTKTIGSYNFENLLIAKDGTFEIILGGSKRTGNWIPLDPDSEDNFLLIRRTVPDWGNSDMGALSIDRISPIEPGHYDYDEFDEAAMARRIHRAELFMRYIPEHWSIGQYDMYIAGAGGKMNTMGLLPGVTTDPANEPTSNYAMGGFSLQDDEALIVSMDKVPDGAYWGFQLADNWDRALNYADHQASLNHAQVILDKDGGFHLVISKRDPGVANWLDTAARHQGLIVLRNYSSRVASVPKVQKVKFDNIRANLPPETAMVTPEQRLAALEHRRLAIIKFYGE